LAGFIVDGRAGWKTRPRKTSPHALTLWVCWKGWKKVVLFSERGHGITAVAVVDRDVPVQPFGYLSLFQEVLVMKKKKPQAASTDAQHLAPVESMILGRHQALVNHAAITKYDDGDPRQVGWWTVKTLGSAWVVEVKDPDTAMRLVVIQATADDALTLAALLLDSEEAPWEPDPWLMKAKLQKRK
jgi:hypothetical protein